MSVFILSCKISLGNTSDILMKDDLHLVLMEDRQALDPKCQKHPSWHPRECAAATLQTWAHQAIIGAQINLELCSSQMSKTD